MKFILLLTTIISGGYQAAPTVATTSQEFATEATCKAAGLAHKIAVESAPGDNKNLVVFTCNKYYN